MFSWTRFNTLVLLTLNQQDVVSLPVRACICGRQTEILLPRCSTIGFIEANFFASFFMVGLYFAYAYTNKIKTSVSLETTTTLVSS